MKKKDTARGPTTPCAPEEKRDAESIIISYHQRLMTTAIEAYLEPEKYRVEFQAAEKIIAEVKEKSRSRLQKEEKRRKPEIIQ